ncbi:MAG: DUF2237 family protein [Magnetovibrionaceae bacterium]
MSRGDGGGGRPGRQPSINVLGQALESCSTRPLTGFYRNGCCDTGSDDHGCHTVCCEVTDAFLKFSMACGNDLSTPRPEFGFDGLKPGDRWCLCAGRWQEAFIHGAAPRVVLRSTHRACLDYCDLKDLKANAVDLS